MDIRIINGEGKIMNVSRMHMEVTGEYLIGLTEDMQQVVIERCRSNEEAVGYLDGIKDAIKVAIEEDTDNVLVDLEGKEYKCKCEGGCKCGKRQDD